MNAPSKVVERLWLQYRNAVIPREAHAVQLQECRRAFYAGAHALITELIRLFDQDREPTPADLALMSAIDAELTEFAARVEQGLT
jgi:hypothetical protein